MRKKKLRRHRFTVDIWFSEAPFDSANRNDLLPHFLLFYFVIERSKGKKVKIKSRIFLKNLNSALYSALRIQNTVTTKGIYRIQCIGQNVAASPVPFVYCGAP